MTRKGDTKIDWPAAFAHYLAQGPDRTYAETARVFGCSEAAVRQKGKRSRPGWVKSAQVFDAKIIDTALDQTLRARAQRVASLVNLTDLAVIRAIELIAARAIEPQLSDIPGLVRVAELLEGQATERLEVSDVQVTLRVFLQDALEFVPEERHDEFLDVIEGSIEGLSGGEARGELEP